MKQKVAIVSLGCSKNLLDAEQMMAALVSEGFDVTFSDTDCDILFVNTCSFVGSAREESYSAIENALKKKKSGKIQKVVVTGCLPQLVGESLRERFKNVDSFLGTGVNYLAPKAARGEVNYQCSAQGQAQGRPMPRLQLTLPHVAYLRIAEGCSHKCTFCTIPSIRGPYHSFPVDDLLGEAEALAKVGVKELILIAQDTAIYGGDLNSRTNLKELVAKLGEINGIAWIRPMYINPMHLDGKVLQVFEQPKVLPYFDIPLQHINDDVLEGMGRSRPNGDEIKILIRRIRATFPESTIRSSLIVGFPYEDAKAFYQLCEFVKWSKLDRLGVFEFSREAGTPAYGMQQVSAKVARSRREKLMQIQQEVSLVRNEAQIGKVIPVIIDQIGKEGSVGRSMSDAPEVDGVVTVRGAKLSRGQIVNVRVNSCSPYDLGGVKVAS